MPKRYIPTSKRSTVQVRKANAKQRLRRLRKALASGRVPIMRKVTPGAAELYREYNADPGYVPRPGMDPHIEKRIRRKLSREREETWPNVKFDHLGKPR